MRFGLRSAGVWKIALLGLLTPTSAFADAGKVEIGGRVFARGEAVRVEGEETEAHATIASARLEAKYDWQWLRAVVELEFRDGADLRDVYLRASNDVWRGQAGRFKEPVSAIEMESAWDLPMASRGYLHDVLTDQLGIAGRHLGAMGTWRGEPLDARVSVGLFQGTDLDGNELADAARAAARGSVQVSEVELGTFFEYRESNPAGRLTRLWAAGVDATVKVIGIRAWMDAIVGSSWEDETVDQELARFALVRLIAAYRLGGKDSGDLYLEPFVSGGLLDPDLDIRADLMTELALGVNVGAWKRARLQLEVERHHGRRNSPEQLEPVPFPNATFDDRLAFLCQIGAAF
jgi:hypothetical protein